jgi:hypothetical protein
MWSFTGHYPKSGNFSIVETQAITLKTPLKVLAPSILDARPHNLLGRMHGEDRV